MRITLATNSLLPADKEGGPAHSNFYLAKALQGVGVDARILTTDRNGTSRLKVPLDRWIERDGVPVYYASTNDGAWIRSPSYATAAREVIAASDVCILSGIFWNYTGLVASVACRSLGVPYVTMPRGLLRPWALRHKGLKKRLYWTLLAGRIVRNSAALIAVARQELDDIRAMGLAVPTYVIPNGAFTEDVADDDRSKCGVEPRPYVLFLGRIHAIKGLDILLPAFERVSREQPDLSLVIAGTVDEAYRPQFEKLLAASGARDRIQLIGNIAGSRKSRLLAGATVFALTSHSEGMPVAVLEALAAGLPVVITSGCNLPEVAAAEAGIEVHPDSDAVAAAIGRLLADADLRTRIGSNARKLAAEEFSWDGIARRVLAVCRSVARTS